jgi:hypothetical protein
VPDLREERAKLEKLSVEELEEGVEVQKWGPDIIPIARSILARKKGQISAQHESVSHDQAVRREQLLLRYKIATFILGAMGTLLAFWRFTYCP